MAHLFIFALNTDSLIALANYHWDTSKSENRLLHVIMVPYSYLKRIKKQINVIYSMIRGLIAYSTQQSFVNVIGHVGFSLTN